MSALAKFYNKFIIAFLHIKRWIFKILPILMTLKSALKFRYFRIFRISKRKF